MNEVKDTLPKAKLLELISSVLKALEPEYKWFVDSNILNDKIIDIGIKHWEHRWTSLLLDTNEDMGYKIHYAVLVLTHHHEWHKGLSIKGMTINPYKWYPQLADQLKYIKEHPEYGDKVLQEADVLEEVNEIREIVKRDYFSHTP